MSAEFWTSQGQYGLVHKAAGPSTDVMVLFIHGVFGDCGRTWGRMPQWVLDAAGLDLDVASFSYPSRLWERTAITPAADDLKTWLETELKGYRHLLFVTHSTGGLVVKEMLRRAYRDGRGLSPDSDPDALPSLWLRTRRIINIAVPHRGGDPLMAGFGKVAYATVYPLMAPLLRTIRFVTQGSKDWGRNEIIAALRWHNPWLLTLEREFMEAVAGVDGLGLPVPVTHDIYAKSDLSVPIQVADQDRDIYFRGTHGSVKVPKRPNAPIVSIVAGFVGRYGADPALQVVDRTLVRVAEVNRVTGTTALIAQVAGEAAPADRAVATANAASLGTQEDICALVSERLMQGRERPRQIVVTGAAGVGKSAVMRMLAWRLGRRYLAQPGPATPFPLFIPMQQVTLSREDPPAGRLWEALWAWWSAWVTHLYPGRDHLSEWIEEVFRNRAVTVILDGVDDFLVNHPTMGLSSVVDTLRGVVTRYRDNPRFAIVAAVRSGLHGLERLASDPRDVLEVLRLTVPQAERTFPACKRWLPRVTDPRLLELVLTPLILSNFEPDTEHGFGARPLTAGTIMDETLRTILRRSHLVGLPVADGATVEIDHVLDALTLVAWLFFYKHRGEIDTETLLAEARTVVERWRADLASDPALAGGGSDVLFGFGLVGLRVTCAAIAQRTVFVATGPDKVRFIHRSWQDFLLARYFVLCLKWGCVADFGVTAFNSHIYRMAGEGFRDVTIGEGQVRSVLEAWRRSKNTYISGNVIAFLAWTETAVDPSAIQLLLEELAHFEPLSRVVAIAGLGYRVLLNSATDRSLGDLRRALFPKLRLFSNPDTTPVRDPVACSLAWCYQKAFAGLFGLPKPEVPWPRIGFSDAETAAALPMICTVSDGTAVVDARSRSLQLAFLVPILDAYHDPKLAIRALHYLYYLVVARKHGVHVFELSQELPQLLKPGCEFEKVIASFSVVPEVLELYRACQALHAGLEAGTA